MTIKKIIDGISWSLSCLHMNHIELINGAGLGRIKLLSTLLVMFMHRLRIVVYAPFVRDIIGLLNGVYDQWRKKDFTVGYSFS